MRIHTNLSERDALSAVNQAANYARVTVAETVTLHGSRSRDRAVNVYLEGASSRPRNSGTYGAQGGRAATYDQWGHFLAYLYEVDAEIKAGPYANAADFHGQTAHNYKIIED